MHRDGTGNFVSVTVTMHEGGPQERDPIGGPPVGTHLTRTSLPQVFHNDATASGQISTVKEKLG